MEKLHLKKKIGGKYLLTTVGSIDLTLNKICLCSASLSNNWSLCPIFNEHNLHKSVNAVKFSSSFCGSWWLVNIASDIAFSFIQSFFFSSNTNTPNAHIKLWKIDKMHTRIFFNIFFFIFFLIFLIFLYYWMVFDLKVQIIDRK